MDKYNTKIIKALLKEGYKVNPIWNELDCKMVVARYSVNALKFIIEDNKRGHHDYEYISIYIEAVEKELENREIERILLTSKTKGKT